MHTQPERGVKARHRGDQMITIDVLGIIFYAQLGLSVLLFFAIQLLVLAARSKIERVADWLIYKGTWLGVASQVVFLTIVGILVWNTPTDASIVGHTVLLILANTIWFISLRVVFEFVDYYITRQESS